MITVMTTETKVELLRLTSDPERLIGLAAMNCYGQDPSEDISDERLKKVITHCLDSGHTSILEHASMTFFITCDRATSHQLVRTRHASYSQRSQRYVDILKDKVVEVIVPPTLEDDARIQYLKSLSITLDNALKFHKAYPDVKPEDLRFMYPNACATQIVMTLNFRTLSLLCHTRLCNRAQWGIRSIVNQMMDLLIPHCSFLNHRIFNPNCYYLGKCPEKNPCDCPPKKRS